MPRMRSLLLHLLQMHEDRDGICLYGMHQVFRLKFEMG
jgi:hypothetical protein